MFWQDGIDQPFDFHRSTRLHSVRRHCARRQEPPDSLWHTKASCRPWTWGAIPVDTVLSPENLRNLIHSLLHVPRVLDSDSPKSLPSWNNTYRGTAHGFARRVHCNSVTNKMFSMIQYLPKRRQGQLLLVWVELNASLSNMITWTSESTYPLFWQAIRKHLSSRAPLVWWVRANVPSGHTYSKASSNAHNWMR